MRTQQIKSLLLLGVLATLCLTARAQEQPEPERLRRQAKELQAKAHELKVDGNADRSEKLMQESKELLRKADRLNESRREPDAPAPSRSDRRPDRERVGPPRADREEGMTPRDDRRFSEESERFQPQLRRYHLKRAIWHLRAAGLFEQADRLEQRVRAIPERFRQPRQEEGREIPAPRFRSERRLEREFRGPREPQERGERTERREREERP